MTVILVVVGVMLLGALVAAAGGFRSRPRTVRRDVVVERPAREVVREPATERVVERRTLD